MINRNKLLCAIGIVLATIGFGSSAFAQKNDAFKNCTVVTDAKSTDGNYKSVTIQRPASGKVRVGQPTTVEVSGQEGVDRFDKSRDKPIVETVYKCPRGETALRVVVTNVTSEVEETQLMIPDAAKSMPIVWCSGTVQACFGGKFEGDFSKPVVLVDLNKAAQAAKQPKAPATAEPQKTK